MLSGCLRVVSLNGECCVLVLVLSSCLCVVGVDDECCVLLLVLVLPNCLCVCPALGMLFQATGGHPQHRVTQHGAREGRRM